MVADEMHDASLDSKEHIEDARINSDTPTAPDFARDMAISADLNRLRSAGSIMMTPEMFERLYLQPQGPVKGDLRKTFGNPTPLALVGFVIALTPLSCNLMGWRGSGGLGAANIGVFYFIGGPCMMIGGFLEFLLGNTFSFVVFMFYGGIFLGWAATLHPYYNSAGAYSPTASYAEGLTEPSFYASLAFWPMAAGILTLYFMICAVRINAVFFMVFFTIALGFELLAGAFWEFGNGDMDSYNDLLQGGGGCWFAASILGWYLLLIQLLDASGFTWKLPVGDFSKYWDSKRPQLAQAEV
ncbi:Protein alcS [Pseudocercospora fuligena]|uniref:Protein alcS n=1 Tax=Pseudocercospora fuligena TaxID=685502 RepID=A0A8H6RLX0_9PEZI|nr:Protein alcS [Pseudocercospora fuligena]